MPFGSGRTWQWNWDVASGLAGCRTESDPRSTSGEGAGAGRFWTKVCRPNPALGGRNSLLMVVVWILSAEWFYLLPRAGVLGSLAKEAFLPLLVFAATWML